MHGVSWGIFLSLWDIPWDVTSPFTNISWIRHKSAGGSTCWWNWNITWKNSTSYNSWRSQDFMQSLGCIAICMMENIRNGILPPSNNNAKRNLALGREKQQSILPGCGRSLPTRNKDQNLGVLHRQTVVSIVDQHFMLGARQIVLGRDSPRYQPKSAGGVHAKNGQWRESAHDGRR